MPVAPPMLLLLLPLLTAPASFGPWIGLDPSKLSNMASNPLPWTPELVKKTPWREEEEEGEFFRVEEETGEGSLLSLLVLLFP